MLPGPILRREMKAATSGRGWFIARVVLGLLIGGGVVAPVFSSQSAVTFKAESIHNYAAYVFAVAIGIEILFLAPQVAVSAGVSIAEEREKDTLSLLLLTRLTRLELAATKLLGRLLPSLLLALVGFPFVVIGGWWAGLTVLLTVEVFAMLAGALAVAAGFGILASARCDRLTTARMEGVGWTMAWLIGAPLLSRMPTASGTLWGEILVEIRRVCSWLAPSSPLSLVTDPAWLSSGAPVGDALSERLLLMAGLQAVVLGVILAGVVASLRLREPHPREWDAFGGYRPPVGDDPIYWREYLLPRRGGRRPVIWIYLRQLMILLRAILINTLQALLIFVLSAMMIGMVVGAGVLSYGAFREAWLGRVLPSDPYRWRDSFNVFIRFVTFFIGLTPASATAAAMATQIVTERDKKTWDSLLATPLSGAEILGSKIWAIVRGLWQAGRWLLPLWLLGVVCDALHPLGFFAAATGLVAVAYLGLGLGSASALKPGATSQSINSRAALWMIALMGLGGLTIIAPLCSRHQVDVLWTLAPWLPDRRRRGRRRRDLAPRQPGYRPSARPAEHRPIRRMGRTTAPSRSRRDRIAHVGRPAPTRPGRRRLSVESVCRSTLCRTTITFSRSRSSMTQENAGMKVYGWMIVATLGLIAAHGVGMSSADDAAERVIPDGPLGDVIRLGKELVEHTTTHPLTKPYVGNALNCTSCHLENGEDPEAASFIGVASAYPAWAPREGRVVTLEDRILNCFMRSCNGVRPPLGSRASVALTAYITWLSTDVPLRMNPSGPHGPNAVKPLKIAAESADLTRGEAVYAEKCAECHAKNGDGRKKNPPVWGPRSYNHGAGLAKPVQLAAWLKVAMPLDDPDLTEQEALDVAAYVNSHDRPAFNLQDHLPAASKLGEYNSDAGTPKP